MRRPWHKFSWDTRSCGLHGHITYRPDESVLADRISTTTAVGEAWRCLRCGEFVVGEPLGSGPADQAPPVMRGRALRDAVILRLLAAERLVRGLLLLALAYGVYRFNGSQDSLRETFNKDLPLLETLARRLGVDLQSAGPVHLIQRALSESHSTLVYLTIGVAAYGLLELLEAVGLFLIKRWGEYVAVVGTGIFLPLEIYELTERVTVLRLAAFAVNLFAVVYLVYGKRLFGVRGGYAAFEAERGGEALLEVERAAVDADLRHDDRPHDDRPHDDRPHGDRHHDGPATSPSGLGTAVVSD